MQAITLAELLATEFEDAEWLVESLIPAEGITVLSAEPSSFKTWLVLYAVICIARGENLFGQYDTAQCGVLIVDEESSSRLLHKRFNMLAADSNLDIHLLNETGFQLDNLHVNDAIAFCKEHDIKLVTFDSLVRIHSFEENDATAMSKAFKQLKKFNKAGITVVVIHHNRKPGAKNSSLAHEMRGSSDILAAVDCHLALTKREDNKHELVLTQTKSRYSEEIAPIEIRTVTDGETTLTFEYIGQAKPKISKQAKTWDAIRDMLDEHSELNQSEIHTKLQETEGKTSMHSLRKILQEKASRNALLTKTSAHGAINYRKNTDSDNV